MVIGVLLRGCFSFSFAPHSIVDTVVHLLRRKSVHHYCVAYQYAYALALAPQPPAPTPTYMTEMINFIEQGQYNTANGNPDIDALWLWVAKKVSKANMYMP
jgi:hypothetical protein